MMPYEPIPNEQKRQMAVMWRELWDSLLVGNAAPVVRARYARMGKPRPGDFVVEASTLPGLLGGSLSPEAEANLWDGQFTRFLRTEAITHDYDDGSTWSEEAMICENPDGSTYTWTNADLIVAPITDRLIAPS